MIKTNTEKFKARLLQEAADIGYVSLDVSASSSTSSIPNSENVADILCSNSNVSTVSNPSI